MFTVREGSDQGCRLVGGFISWCNVTSPTPVATSNVQINWARPRFSGLFEAGLERELSPALGRLLDMTDFIWVRIFPFHFLRIPLVFPSSSMVPTL